MKLKNVVEQAGLEVKLFASGDNHGTVLQKVVTPSSLLLDSLVIEPVYPHSLKQRLSIMVAGSAGGGVQSAAEWFARAAVMCGLDVTLRGAYPVTVGVGFSAAQINVSPEPITYTGSPVPDVLIVASSDGANYARSFAAKMSGGLMLMDDSLENLATGAEVLRVPLSSRLGTRDAAILGLMWFLHRERLFPPEALMDVLTTSRGSRKVKVEKLLSVIQGA
jgi:hypothetical protein